MYRMYRSNLSGFLFFLVFTGCFFQERVCLAAVKDAESGSHADTAAIQVMVNNYEYPGLQIVQFNLAVLSHYSYMVISNKEALVVDPDRDIQVYLDTAKKEGWTIKGVFLTHSHADFVAGHTEFTKAVGCPIYQNKESGAVYKMNALSDGQQIPWGEVTFQFMTSPGHTPDGMCMLIFSKDDKTVPKVMLTGDTLFVGSVGRPDLMEGTMAAATLARMSYDTWTNKLSKLDDSVVVLPAHGAGSLCGVHLRDEPSSSIGTERKTNPYLQHKGKNDFITAVLEGLPEAPQYFKHNAKMNREGPPLVDWSAALAKIHPLDASLMDQSRYSVVDLRDAKSFAAGHLPNSVNIGLRGRLETWVGIMVSWGQQSGLVRQSRGNERGGIPPEQGGLFCNGERILSGMDLGKATCVHERAYSAAGTLHAHAGRYRPPYCGRSSAHRVDGTSHRQRRKHAP